MVRIQAQQVNMKYKLSTGEPGKNGNNHEIQIKWIQIKQSFIVDVFKFMLSNQLDN